MFNINIKDYKCKRLYYDLNFVIILLWGEEMKDSKAKTQTIIIAVLLELSFFYLHIWESPLIPAIFILNYTVKGE